MKQDKAVSVYWTEEFIEGLDDIAHGSGMKRNEYIKAAVREKMRKDLNRVKTGATISLSTGTNKDV
jgi:metal-responsive CopG/Arc/MetJ family transcriptional regulator